MTRTEFLQKVVADKGRFCIFAAHTRSHYFFDTPEDAEEQIDELVEAGVNVYFAPCTFQSDKRGNDNVQLAKSFYLDLDCGADKAVEGKGYADQATALEALRKFVKSQGLPAPMLVNSGRGIHVYWVLDTPVTLDEWKPVATGLKKLCVEQGLLIDPAVTADAARILRPVGTKNFKDPTNPLDVVLLRDAAPITLDAMRNVVPVQAPVVGMHAPMDDVTRALLGNKIAKFRNILARGENGCRQLIHIFENQATLDEPLWRAGLSVAWACEDADKAIHKISKGHPDYDPRITIQKAEHTEGPYRCETFNSLNPGLCDGCPHRGKIASPIRLGEEVLVAQPEHNLFQTIEETPEGEQIVVQRTIPDYPFPYIRGINGGVYRRMNLPDGGIEDVSVYRNDFYITKRLTDVEKGETLMAVVHLPKDGVREFSLPLMDALASDRLRDRLAMNGVAIAGAKEMQEIMKYVTTWTHALQAKEEAETSRTQFGWADDNSVFILGDREYRQGGDVRYSPPSNSTIAIAPLLRQRGTLEAWKSVVNMYARPGNEVRAFAFFMGFGAPLLSFTPLRGGLLNLMSPESGTGKSTVQMAINSIYGSPYELLLQKADTINARIHRVGIMNNLPVTIDEITNMQGDQLSELAYAITQGRGKDRMKSQGNELRANHTRWQTLVISSGNSSIYDKLTASKADPDGEIMRVMEFKVERDNTLSKEESDMIFGKLHENFGVAGDVYIRYLLDNRDYVSRLVDNIQQKVDEQAGFGARERFWSAMTACAIAGGIISQTLGLHDIDPRKILKWVCKVAPKMQRDVTTVRPTSSENVGVFLMEHARHMLVMNGNPNAAGIYDKPIKEPYGELLIRAEPDTKHIYISTSHLRKWCTERQISFKDMVDDLVAAGMAERDIKKRLSTGTGLPGIVVNTVRITAQGGGFEFPNTNEIAEPETADS